MMCNQPTPYEATSTTSIDVKSTAFSHRRMLSSPAATLVATPLQQLRCIVQYMDITTATNSQDSGTDAGTDPVQRLLDAIAAGTGVPATIYSDDASLDATVPNWRLEAAGATAISRELSNWYHDPATLDRVRRLPFPGGVAVEVDFSWEDGAVPHASHQLHLLTIDGGRVAAHTVFCGGRWDAALLAQMEASRGQ